MSCPGLHCACCSGGGGGIAILALVAFEGAEWVATHLVEVIATGATCAILATATAIALFKWADRRDARRAALWQFQYAREAPSVRTENRDFLSASAERPALGFRDLHVHLDGLPSAEQAAVIRQALNGRTSQL